MEFLERPYGELPRACVYLPWAKPTSNFSKEVDIGQDARALLSSMTESLTTLAILEWMVISSEKEANWLLQPSDFTYELQGPH